MRVIVNHIPKKWHPNNKLAFMKWMKKIKNINYSKIE